ncbi:MAG: hypothetical protein Q8P67_12535 [archaeon]|nr:hypothetical protein [archaeon]
MGAASKAHPIGDLLIIAVALATGIVWLLIGVDNHDLDCLRGATDIAGIPEMATWLIVEGAFLIGYACIQILLFPCKHLQKARKNVPGAKALLWANNIWLLLASLWHLAWLIVGAVQLSKCMFISYSSSSSSF